MIYVPWLPHFWTLLGSFKRILCYDLPAVDINNHIINERHQHTHTCHYVSQIVPVYVHTKDQAYNCTGTAGYHC